MQRRFLPLNQNWLYGGKYRKGSEGVDFDESGFERINIPHTNKLFSWHQVDNKDYEFISIYRRNLKLPQKFKNKRIFIEFEGVSLMATVFLNGNKIGHHKGGYTPFSFEITEVLKWSEKNVIAVKVDSRERKDIPPYGKGPVDYLTYGGIYREVNLLVVDDCFIQDVFATQKNVLSKSRSLEVECSLDGFEKQNSLSISARLYDGKNKVSETIQKVKSDKTVVTVKNLHNISLWDIDNPKLYKLKVVLKRRGRVIDDYSVNIGFRKAVFTEKGFKLNGRLIKIRGLNRHQSYPYIGYAAPKRLQRYDADLLKFASKCNIVRTSHYPQSKHFLDRCDEIGLLVFEEMTGWQNIGDKNWKNIACSNLKKMIIRDRNHPSIILWGVRINESSDDNDFYGYTNKLAHELDSTRQTGGVRNIFESKLLEDVFTINDFSPDKLKKPNHRRYLVTEFCGHTFPTKVYDNVERITEHVKKHASRHDQVSGNAGFAGAIAWCMCDYNTHSDFGSGDRICHHGILDMFRFEKPAALFYKSQCDPKDEIVLEPIFLWSMGDWSGDMGLPYAMVCSNCDKLKFYIGKTLVSTEYPCREDFKNLPYPPFVCRKLIKKWGVRYEDLTIEGYIKGKKVISKRMSSAGLDAKFHLTPDSRKLYADGTDMTFLRFFVTDEFNNIRPYAQGAVQLEITGPGEIIGENPFALVGGKGAVLVRSKQSSGKINITASHDQLGIKQTRIVTVKRPKEAV